MKKTLLFLFSDLANKLFKNYPNGIYLFFTLCLSVLFFSCENEPLGASDPTNEVKSELPYTTKSMSLKDVPEVESYVRSILSIKTNKSVTSKSINDLEHGASFDIEKIVETTDSISNKNYSIRFVFDDTPENVFYNLVVNFLPNGQKHAFVQKQTCNPENYIAFRNSRYDMNHFNGKIELFYHTAFFGKKATTILSKTVTVPCQPSFYPNGDPIPTLSSFITPGGIQSSGGSSSTGGDPNTTNGNASWPATGGYGLSVFSTGNASSSSSTGSTNTGNNGGSGFNWTIYFYNVGQKISNVINTVVGWFVKECHCPVNKTASDPCPTIVPLGFTTFISEPERLAILRSQIRLTLEQWQWLHGKDEFMESILSYINTNPTVSKTGNAVNMIGFFTQQNNFRANDQVFVDQFIAQRNANPSLNLDFLGSYFSPMNIDLDAIDLNSPEGEKFIEIYGKLIQSPEFKKLFIDIFGGTQTRFNVKFEIGSVQNGANGNTNTDLNNPTLNTITISPDFLKNSNKMRIAKTIIHECIHAYLNVKLCDSGQGLPIPTLNDLDFFNVVNQQYNGFKGNQDQHNFIYNYMLPTMKTILADVKDLLVTQVNNSTMINDTYVYIPFDYSPSTHFIWSEFYHNLALSGLQNCAFFQNEIGTIKIINGVPTVTNTVDQTLMQSYNQYNKMGDLYINP